MVPSFVPKIGADGLATDVPIISYTEQVLEEKELKLKQYIQDNYSKIRNVEKELATLALEVKLTAGPKKLALEHLRKKIEVATEKVKAAKVKEEQARKVWQAAENALRTEEAQKQTLCDDLNRLVQESASAQYSRLEDLSMRLEALNPDLRGTASQIFAANSEAISSSQQPPVKGQEPLQTSLVQGEDGTAVRHREDQNGGVSEGNSAAKASFDPPEKRAVTRGQHSSRGRGQGRSSAGRGKGPLVLHRSRSDAEGGWTGAGFDVEGSFS